MDEFGKDFDADVKMRVKIDSRNLAKRHGYVPKKKVKVDKSIRMVKEPVTSKLDENVPMEVVQEEPVEQQFIGKFKVLEDKDESALVSKSVLKEVRNVLRRMVKKWRF